MSFKIEEIKTLEAEIENLAYEKPFGEYAIFKNGFFKLNDKGIKIIHDTSELICSHWGANQWCHHFICELLDLYSGVNEFNCSLGTYKHQKELPQCWNNNTETVIKWFNKHSNKLWYKLAEKSFDVVMLTIQYNAKDLNT
jgi:hypothetical protein